MPRSTGLAVPAAFLCAFLCAFLALLALPAPRAHAQADCTGGAVLDAAETARRYVSNGRTGALWFSRRALGATRASVDLGRLRIPVPLRAWNEKPGKTIWYPLKIAADMTDFCLEGGQFLGQLPLTIGWHDSKGNRPGAPGRNSAAIAFHGARTTVRGAFISNQHDGIRVHTRVTGTAPAYLLTGNWLEYTRDDCIEADSSMASGSIRDNFFDGCYVFFSIRGGKPKNGGKQPSRTNLTIDISGNLIRMEPMPYPYKWETRAVKHHLQIPRDGKTVPHGHGAIFKLDGTAAVNPGFAIDANIFLLQKLQPAGLLAFPPDQMIRSCRGNTIVWVGAEPLDEVRAALAQRLPAACDIRLTDDPAVWRAAVAKWRTAHPRFAGYAAPRSPDSYALPRPGTGALR